MRKIDFAPIRLSLFLLCSFLNLSGQEKIEDTTIKTMSGKQIEIVDHQNIYLFYMWKTTSKVSHEDIKYLNDLVNTYKDRNIIFVAATTDKQKKLEKFLNTSDFLFNHVCGKEGKRTIKLFNANEIVRFYPRYYIVDKNGNIVTSAIGSCETIHSLIENELNK